MESICRDWDIYCTNKTKDIDYSTDLSIFPNHKSGSVNRDI